MNNVVNQVAYLRTSREFPEDLHQIAVESNKSYVDISNAVNARTIGIFPTNRPAITGESWFIDNRRQQALRQVYSFTTTADIPLGFKIRQVNAFSRTFGEFTDGTNWYGLIPGSNVAIPGQISFFIFQDAASTMTDLIRFVIGAGAPVLIRGIVDIEWLSQI